MNNRRDHRQHGEPRAADGVTTQIAGVEHHPVSDREHSKLSCRRNRRVQWSE